MIYFYSFSDNGTPAGFYEPATYWEAGKSAQDAGTDWMPLLLEGHLCPLLSHGEKHSCYEFEERNQQDTIF